MTRYFPVSVMTQMLWHTSQASRLPLLYMHAKIGAFPEGSWRQLSHHFVYLVAMMLLFWIGTQGWTPLHVAVFPKTHIKDLLNWNWMFYIREGLREWYIDNNMYGSVSKQMISCISLTCYLSHILHTMCKLFAGLPFTACPLAEGTFIHKNPNTSQ